jgi:hypothetical protein
VWTGGQGNRPTFTNLPSAPAKTAALCWMRLSLEHDAQPSSHTPAWFAVQNLLCPANNALQPQNCTHIETPLSRIKRPRMEAWKDRAYTQLSTLYQGFEDVRAFSWRGRLHFMGTVILGKYRKSKGVIQKVALARLSEDASQLELGAVLNCPGMRRSQKNYMPLVIKGTLYVVLTAYPFIVARIDPATFRCSVVQKEDEAAASLQAVRLACTCGAAPVHGMWCAWHGMAAGLHMFRLAFAHGQPFDKPEYSDTAAFNTTLGLCLAGLARRRTPQWRKLLRTAGRRQIPCNRAPLHPSQGRPRLPAPFHGCFGGAGG